MVTDDCSDWNERMSEYDWDFCFWLNSVSIWLVSMLLDIQILAASCIRPCVHI
jgi:hypothetical protein